RTAFVVAVLCFEVGVVLELCTIADRGESGDSWINSIIDMTQGSFNDPVDGPQRSQYIARLQKMSIASQFSEPGFEY
ncbi:hypothetical protein ACLBSM_32550, partial [Klebsiella pneumoniae]